MPLSSSNSLLPRHGSMMVVLPAKALAGKFGCMIAI
jgi:hypothetical protein